MSEQQDFETPAEDVEAEARKHGWAPREKWRGRPEEFIEAEEFLRRGREFAPIVRARFDQARAENEKLKRELVETQRNFDRRIQTAEKMARRTLDMQREQLLADFDAQKRAAATTGDTATYDRVVQTEREAFTRLAEEERAVQPQPAPQGPQLPREAIEWAERNPWFTRDQSLALEAQAVHIALLQEQPALALADNLERVTETLKQRYPRKFGIEPQTQRSFSAVDSGSNGRSGQTSREKGWKDLPPEARTACNEMMERGYLRGDAKKVQEQYAKTYWDEYGE